MKGAEFRGKNFPDKKCWMRLDKEMLHNIGISWLLVASALGGHAEDWPQFLGPHRNGKSNEQVATRFPVEGPKVLWKKAVGQGFAGPVVREGKLVVFHRLGETDVVQCLNAESGAEIWKFSYLTRYKDDFGFDEGPRSTPAISGSRVFTMSADGVVHGLDFGTGKRLWELDTRKAFGGGKGFFGMACSPLVANDLVLLNIGGKNGAGIIALDEKSGELKWKATDDEASYSSPVLAKLGGPELALFLTRERLVGLQTTSGKLEFEFPFRSRMDASVNAAAPLVIGNKIFLSASYDTGATLLQFENRALKQLWHSEDALSSHYASVVHHEGYLYGFDGRQEYGPGLVCVEVASGKSAWRVEGFGAGTVLIAGEKLVVLKESGELVIAPATGKEFRPETTAQLIGSCRAYPAIAGGKLLARDTKFLVAADIREP